MGRGTSKAGGGTGGSGNTKLNQGIDLETVSAQVIEMVINQANDLDALDAIIEQIANNDVISNAEYSRLYQKALRKAQSWQPGNR